VLVAAGLLMAGDALAGAAEQQPGDAPPVETLVARALAAAPSLAARRERVEAARLAAQAADVPPDPSIEFEFRGGQFPAWTLGSDPMSMIGASVRQPLLTGGRKQARRAEAEAEVGVRQAQAAQSATDLATAVRTAYARLYAIDRERAVLGDAREIARLLAETVTARYAAGGADQASALRAQLEQTRLAQRGTDLEAERQVATASIDRLLNQPPDTPLGEVRSLPAPPLPDAMSRLPDLAAERAPDVLVQRAGVNAAARGVDAARAELHPTFTVGGGLYWQGGTGRIATATFGVEWPARKSRKQLPLLAASERTLDAARHDLEDASAATRAEAAELLAGIERDDRQVEQYRSALLPQSSATFDAVRASYLTGRGEFSSVLDEFRRWTDLRVELAGLEADRFALGSRLDALVGSLAPAAAPAAVPEPPSSKEPR
jgi:outer membrane protein TolC